MQHRIFIPRKGWLELLPTGGWKAGLQADATELSFTKGQAAIEHLALPDNCMAFPVSYEGVPAADLMTLAGGLMTAATTQTNAAIAPMPSEGGSECRSCGAMAVVETIVPGTNPPVRTKMCRSCGAEN
jgi:hypothetical protein